MKFKLDPERLHRVWRTFKQALYGLALTSVIAVVASLSDILKVEFGQEVWWTVASTVLTAVSAYLMHLREQRKE